MRRMKTCAEILAVAVGLLLSTSAPAQLYTGHYTDEDDFDIQVPGMLDFDQVRARDMPDTQGLPNDGAMYCVPTMTMNFFGFLANNGYSAVAPGAGDWDDETDQDAYYTITENIEALGDLMLTDPNSGTYAADWLTGATAWLEDNPFLVAEMYLALRGSDTTIERAAYHATRGVVGLCYGYYDGSYARYTIKHGSSITTGASGTLGFRNGGHCVSLYSATRVGDLETDMEVMDPDSVPSGDDEYSQSVMTPRDWTTDDVQFSNTVEKMDYFASALRGLTSSGKLRVVDSIHMIRPLWVLTVSTTLQTALVNHLGAFGAGDSAEQISIPGNIREVVMRPDQIFAAAVTRERRRDPARAYLIDVRSGESVEILETPDIRLAFSRFLELYVSNVSEITRFDVNGGEPVSLGSVRLATAPRAMEWIDEVDELWMLAENGDILALPRSLDGTPRRIAGTGLSADLASDSRIRMTAVSGGAVAILGPRSGVVALFHEVDEVLRLTARYDSAHDAMDLSSNDRGNIVVALADGALLELTTENNDVLVQADDSPLEGLFTAGAIEVGRSRTNLDRQLHTGPGWANGGER